MLKKEKIIIGIGAVVVVILTVAGGWKTTGGGCVYSRCEEKRCVNMWEAKMKQSCPAIVEDKCLAKAECSRGKNWQCQIKVDQKLKDCLRVETKSSKDAGGPNQ